MRRERGTVWRAGPRGTYGEVHRSTADTPRGPTWPRPTGAASALLPVPDRRGEQPSRLCCPFFFFLTCRHPIVSELLCDIDRASSMCG